MVSSPRSNLLLRAPLLSMYDGTAGFSQIFEPITLRSTTFQNGIWVSPMCQYSIPQNGELTSQTKKPLGGRKRPSLLQNCTKVGFISGNKPNPKLFRDVEKLCRGRCEGLVTGQRWVLVLSQHLVRHNQTQQETIDDPIGDLPRRTDTTADAAGVMGHARPVQLAVSDSATRQCEISDHPIP
ncbi:hypothetical protein N7462_010074 [Penicillium macrosclerotiorum]|uniref:uncharacterized protein n=1 Tax=Penicillium macrosclerotiorum TaxID=303699 RepID=UPI0025487707|nr:uncharacterized protein N7462_010074 [Penicillium macrosclerotiorum]KAJ5669004.1 hypothetical protein N7462_010074 [Penicillium macrosclerotiorum]